MAVDPLEKQIRANLPIREFMYTPDQVASILNVKMATLKLIVSWQGAEGSELMGTASRKMRAHKIVPSELADGPEWRIPESELVLYMKRNGIVAYERKLKSNWR